MSSTATTMADIPERTVVRPDLVALMYEILLLELRAELLEGGVQLFRAWFRHSGSRYGAWSAVGGVLVPEDELGNGAGMAM